MKAFKKRISIIALDKKLLAFISSLVEYSDKYNLCGAYDDYDRAAKCVPDDYPDIVILNISFPEVKAIETITRIKKIFPQTDILVISQYTEVEVAITALSAGANGYLLPDSLNDLQKHLSDITSGGSPLDGHIARKIIETLQVSRVSPISERETQVLKLMMKGNTYSQIAAMLNISSETSKTHIKNIYKKLNVNSRAEAVKKALEDKLVSSSAFTMAVQ
jgi:DNA-binding NarL/FixJ family response regulator